MSLADSLFLVGALGVAYYMLIGWLVFFRGDFALAYNPLIGRLLDWFGMEEITIGARCFICRELHLAGRTPTPQRLVHERFHYEKQWREYPWSFLPRYFYQLARYGYDKAPIENEARAAAGEPVR